MMATVPVLSVLLYCGCHVLNAKTAETSNSVSRRSSQGPKVLDRCNPEYSGGDCILATADIYKQLVKYGKGLMQVTGELMLSGNNMVRESKL